MKPRSPLYLLAVLVMLLAMGTFPSSPSLAEPPPQDPLIRGPFVSEPVVPAVFNGDLRDLPQLSDGDTIPQEIPLYGIPERKWPAAPSGFADPVGQTWQGEGQMPLPIIDFPGLDFANHGSGWPPDTVGDVGPNHYVQGVNTSFGVYDKTTGAELVAMTFDDLFDGTGTPCDYHNDGDIIVLYDHLADRWILTDFSLPAGPVYQCIAVSQTGNPVSGGWYFYAYVTDDDGSPWHDYPKFGVWPDAYYMTANMFTPWSGGWVWAFEREQMLIGAPMQAVRFEAGVAYGGLLPANLEGPLPPAGAPNYLAAREWPNTFQLWEFHVDWVDPANSTFTGPTELTVADFDTIDAIPQQPPGAMLDSLGDRLMMQLQYRNFGSHEALWVNHTVATGGVAGVRWYEVRDPGGTPYLYQEGTYQPDDLYRWMGSLAVDGDGNMALGYSVSSETMMPAIRYAGRLFGEIPGTLPQAETSLIEGTGVQVGITRWGDYSAMTVDPVDDCTFWYTQEYYAVTGSNWQTRIGSFRFPSCGQPKGWISGTVRDANTSAPIPGVPVTAEGVDVTLTVQTDTNGQYNMTLLGGSYDVTAGPLPPGYPDPETVTGVGVTTGLITPLDIDLTSQPHLVEGSVSIDDNVAGGNGNGYPEPGESGLLLWNSVTNDGAASATDTGAYVTALTPGVTPSVADSTYPDIAPGETMTNNTPFVFSIAPTVPCGTDLDFEELLVTAQGNFTTTFSLLARVPLPLTTIFSDDMESGPDNWTTGGTYNQWAITEEQSHSPTHAWSDSPYGDYYNNTNAWLRSPTFDLSGKFDVALSFWHRYDLEIGFDFGYLEYSLDGGTSWEPALGSYSGHSGWIQETFDVPALDDQPNVTFRFRLQSDGGVTDDGWYIDDVELTYLPFECTYPVAAPGIPVLAAPPDGTITATQAITLTWQAGPGETPDGYNLELDGTVITTTETFSATTLGAGLHSWRVRAFNLAGYSDYSDAWTVEVVAPPAVPVLLAPLSGTVTTTQEITFTWEAGAGGAPDGYNLELDGEVITTTDPFSATTLAVGGHAWRVRAFNWAGTSEYGDAWLLTVEEGLYRVYLPIVVRDQ
jgi:hypothetical protein